LHPFTTILAGPLAPPDRTRDGGDGKGRNGGKRGNGDNDGKRGKHGKHGKDERRVWR
jgi:hypothetical protein